MKKLIGLFALGIGLSAPAYCQFGMPQIVWDPKSTAQLIQDVQQAIKLYNMEREMAAFIKNPGAYGSVLTQSLNAAAQLAQMNPTKMSQQQVEQLSAAIALARLAGQAAANPASMTSATGIELATMQLQQMDAITKMNQVQAELNYQQGVQLKASEHVPSTSHFNAYAGGWVPR